MGRWFILRSSQRRLLRMLNLVSFFTTHITRQTLKVAKEKPEESKSILLALLDMDKSVNWAVGQVADIYYDGKHPKHFLWTSHNDFIVDNIEVNEKVIDIGCGASAYTMRLADKGANVLGIDLNPERITAIKKTNVHPNLCYEVMDIMRELPEERFDVAICSHLIEHLENPVSFLKNLHNITSRIIIKVPRVDSGWKKLMKKDLGLFWLDDVTHFKEYTMDILQNELTKSGWKPVVAETGLDLRVIAKPIE